MSDLDSNLIVGFLPVYNEADILDECINYYIEQGLKIVVIDNGSTDQSPNIIRKYLDKGVLELKIMPSNTYYLSKLLIEFEKWMARLSPSWCFLLEADAFLEPPQKGISLKNAVEEIVKQGYDYINFDNYEFWPTSKDLIGKKSVRLRYRYYTWSDDKQEKGFRYVPEIDIHTYGGHKIIVPGRYGFRRYPTNFIMRHYPIRGAEHGMRKVFIERLPRYIKEMPNWHVHYTMLKKTPSSFIINPSDLNYYEEEGSWVKKRTFNGGWPQKYLKD